MAGIWFGQLDLRVAPQHPHLRQQESGFHPMGAGDETPLSPQGSSRGEGFALSVAAKWKSFSAGMRTRTSPEPETFHAANLLFIILRDTMQFFLQRLLGLKFWV